MVGGMSFEFFDHTADVGARILASSVDELFAEAAIALTATITDPTLVGARTSWEVALQAPDLEQLLVEWMSELIGRFDIDQLFACAAAVRVSRAGEEWRLTAIVQGERLDSARHPLKVLVKGVTYHHLQIWQGSDGCWRATLVLDI